MHVDHVAFGWDDLDTVLAALEAVGLQYDYGGTHADGTTQMALTGFPDGSYLEYIAPTEGTDPRDAGFWPTALTACAGPAAWAVRVDDIVDEAKRAIDAGFRIDGPIHGSRERPDGSLVEWDQVFERVGSPNPWLLPFALTDRSPREWRVSETSGVPTLTGIDTVVLGVDDIAEAAALFERRYRTAAPVPLETDAVEDGAVTLPGSPVALAPASESRLDTVGERPVALLLGTTEIASARTAFTLTPTLEWGDRRMAWFDHDLLRGRVGVIE